MWLLPTPLGFIHVPLHTQIELSSIVWLPRLVTLTWRWQRDSWAGDVARWCVHYWGVVCARVGDGSSARICRVYGHSNIGQCGMRWPGLRGWQHIYCFWVWKPANQCCQILSVSLHNSAVITAHHWEWALWVVLVLTKCPTLTCSNGCCLWWCFFYFGTTWIHIL